MSEGNLFARFAVESNRINSKRIHRKLFEPRKDLTLSVETIDDLSCAPIIEAGKRVAKGMKKEKLYGWAKITRPTIEELSLNVEVDNHPHEGHATIHGWPKERDASILIQQKLATLSYRILLPKPIASTFSLSS
ncbi:MAG: hypothetical protein OYG32_06675 [Rhodospirillaceae bacterium]|nr:hypothetical protein [Rhodospirillaceae bacterium]